MRQANQAAFAREQRRPFVLGFGAWHFQLSDGPILEEMTYA
jgi:hypothetical protein